MASQNSLALIGLAYSSSEDEEVVGNIEIEMSNEEDKPNDEVRSVLDAIVEKVCSMVSQANHQSPSNAFSVARSVNNEDEIEISSLSSASWSLSSDDDAEESPNKVTKPLQPPRTKGELLIEDLPPIENLSIRLQVDQLTQLGRVASVVNQLVVVQSFKGLPALDLDSCLFLKDGTALGVIFDVFGPVVEPRYAVRFNSAEEIASKSIEVDTPIYYAAEHQEPITSYVFVAQLRNLKGSDASWKHNNEPPEDVKEYSDDEQEKKELQKHRAKTRRKQKPKQSGGRMINNNQRFYGNFSQQSPNFRVPPNTPNTPYQHPHFFNAQMNNYHFNWFANSYDY